MESEEAKSKQKERQRKYYSKHKDKMLEQSRRYRKEHPEKWVQYRKNAKMKRFEGMNSNNDTISATRRS